MRFGLDFTAAISSPFSFVSVLFAHSSGAETDLRRCSGAETDMVFAYSANSLFNSDAMFAVSLAISSSKSFCLISMLFVYSFVLLLNIPCYSALLVTTPY